MPDNILNQEEIAKAIDVAFQKATKEHTGTTWEDLVEAGAQVLHSRLQVSDEKLVDVVLHVLLDDNWKQGSFTQASERIIKALAPILTLKIQEARKKERENIVKILEGKEWFGSKLTANQKLEVLNYLRTSDFKIELQALNKDGG